MLKTIKIEFVNLSSKEYEHVDEFIFGKKYLVVLEQTFEIKTHIHKIAEITSVSILSKFGEYRPVLLPKKEVACGTGTL